MGTGWSHHDRPENIEEERRLFYVAITRARKAVTVSFAQNRRKWGSTESNNPSRFLREIDSKYYAVEPDTDLNRYDPFPKTRFSESDFRTFYPERRAAPRPVFSPTVHKPSEDFVPSPVSELRVGGRVEHDRFGFGEILSLEGTGADRKAVVRFDLSGEKTLLLKFAKLRNI